MVDAFKTERYKAAIEATKDTNEKAKLAQEFKLRMAEMEVQRLEDFVQERLLVPAFRL